ncbi:colipase-like protein 2 isoform X5 [Equus caballus]|uniref:colipase-like protein 2 isoform X5 n=1 Tax=Equus caballus TaxID=9796 RepID=UPI0038B32B13
MAAAAALLAGVLLPCWGAFPQLNKGLLKAGCLIRSQMDLKALRHPAGGSAARELLTQGLSPQRNGAGCSHHLECLSDCCLMDLDHGGTFCAPKAGRAMTCLPQEVNMAKFS